MPRCSQEELKSMQKCAAGFTAENHNYYLKKHLFRPQMKLCFRKYENSWIFFLIEKKKEIKKMIKIQPDIAINT